MESIDRIKDIQGAGRLAVDAVVGITDIVEAMHHTIVSFGGVLGNPVPNRTRGIPGIVYKSIRAITELAGQGLDISVNQLRFILEESESSPGREAVLSALNGVLGGLPGCQRQPAGHLHGISLQWKIGRCGGTVGNDPAGRRKGCCYGSWPLHE